LKENPDYAPAHYGLALLYDDAKQGDRRRAAEHYRRYLALAPDAADAEAVRRWLRDAEAAGQKP
jgi:Tfp pilus assembly protein PilF